MSLPIDVRERGERLLDVDARMDVSVASNVEYIGMSRMVFTYSN